MFRKPSIRRPSHPTVVACIALSFALSGTAYAAGTIGSADVIDESLRSVDLKDGAAVKSGDVVDDTVAGGGLVGRDIKESTLDTVPDASRLDGLDSSAFAQGRIISDAKSISPGSVEVLLANNVFELQYNCPSSLGNTGLLWFRNNASTPANLFSDNGSPDPEYRSLTAFGRDGSVYLQSTSPNGEAITFQMQGANIATVWVSSVHRPSIVSGASDCHVQAQAVIN
ncbi:MAG: hypothetical protein H0U51_05705 [Propionibacteriales bacterium]|nr:hypothetical protein [Propionibacteriales bacterium]